MNEDQNYLSSLQYALKLIAKKRYTQAETQKKLEQFLKKTSKYEESVYSDDKVIDSVINRLNELKYLDDEKYAVDYVSSRAQFRPRGVFLLKQELKMKGIEKRYIDQAIDSAITNSELDEVKMAEQLLKKKVKSWSKFEPRKRKEKSFGFLSSKGFKPDTIYKAINRCYYPNAIEDL